MRLGEPKTGLDVNATRKNSFTVRNWNPAVYFIARHFPDSTTVVTASRCVSNYKPAFLNLFHVKTH